MVDIKLSPSTAISTPLGNFVNLLQLEKSFSCFFGITGLLLNMIDDLSKQKSLTLDTYPGFPYTILTIFLYIIYVNKYVIVVRTFLYDTRCCGWQQENQSVFLATCTVEVLQVYGEIDRQILGGLEQIWKQTKRIVSKNY